MTELVSWLELIGSLASDVGNWFVQAFSGLSTCLTLLNRSGYLLINIGQHLPNLLGSAVVLFFSLGVVKLIAGR